MTQYQKAENKDVFVTDCHSPSCIAKQLSNTIMTTKAHSTFTKLFILGILAGVYVAFGAEFATTVTQDSARFLGYGVTKLLSGFAFSIGLMLVIIAGGELFTSNNLIMLSVLENKTNIKNLLRNWVIVYFSNLLGSLLIAFLIFYSDLWNQNHLMPAITALKIATLKVNLTFTEAFIRGILCNWLVCIAVWMSVASKQVIGKIFAIFFPIVAFVACGYEHCIANMYYIPKALLLKNVPGLIEHSGIAAAQFAHLTIPGFIKYNLIPVTLGNITGAVIFVAFLYWFVYLKGSEEK